MQRISQALSLVCMLIPMVACAGETPVSKLLAENGMEPFCANEQSWAPFGVTEDQCMDAARDCATQVAAKQLDVDRASEELYTCVFDELGMPQ